MELTVFLKGVAVALQLINADPRQLLALVNQQLDVVTQQELEQKEVVMQKEKEGNKKNEKHPHPRSQSFSGKPLKKARETLPPPDKAREALPPPDFVAKGTSCAQQPIAVIGAIVYKERKAQKDEGAGNAKKNNKKDPLYKHPKQQFDETEWQKMLQESQKDTLLQIRDEIIFYIDGSLVKRQPSLLKPIVEVVEVDVTGS